MRQISFADWELIQQREQGRRVEPLPAIAAVLDGAGRDDAARCGGMDRQTLRDRMIHFNAHGAAGLVNISPSPGAPAKLDAQHKAFLGGPDPDDSWRGARRGLDLLSGAHHREDGHHAADGKVDVLDRCARRVEHFTGPRLS